MAIIRLLQAGQRRNTPGIAPAVTACNTGMVKQGKITTLFAAAVVGLCLPTAHRAEPGSPLPAAGLSEPMAPGQQDKELEVLIQTLKDGSPAERQRATIALGNKRDARAVEPLIGALADPDSFVRNFAARALGNLGDRRAVEPLTRSLGDESALVRRTAAQALGRLRDPAPVASLIKALGDGSVLVRSAAALALGAIADPGGVKALIAALGDESIAVQDAAVAALLDVGDPAIPALVDALGDWNLGPKSAETLQNLDWKPSSDDDRVRLQVARRDKKSLLADWEQAKRVLLADASSRASRRTVNAIYALIGIGQGDVLGDLVAILDAAGTREMAELFLNCGNARLADAARAWALKHGDARLEESARTVGLIQWGGMGPT